MQLLAALLTLAQSFFGGLPIDGISCDREEGAVEHIHTWIALYDHAHSVVVPPEIGIPQGGACLYWIHTHSADGMVHIESPVRRNFALGEFFDIWGPGLSWTQAAAVTAPRGHRLSIWIDGQAWHGHDPRSIPLRDHETIVIQNGPPFAKPPQPDWSKL
jgi:hypothetical protein